MQVCLADDNVLYLSDLQNEVQVKVIGSAYDENGPHMAGDDPTRESCLVMLDHGLLQGCGAGPAAAVRQ